MDSNLIQFAYTITISGIKRVNKLDILWSDSELATSSYLTIMGNERGHGLPSQY